MTRVRSAALLAGLFATAVSFAACNREPPPPTQYVAAGGSAPAAGSGGSGGSGSGSFEIVFLGDSLTAGLGLLSEQAYPVIVGNKFAADGYRNISIVNAGISGDTSAGGLRRVSEAISGDTRILVVALGGNDSLRGLTTTQTHDNLAGIIDVALNHRIAVLVAGMKAPPNLGEDYRVLFDGIFTRLLSEYRTNITLIPFMLEGVAGNPSLNQPDGIHPNIEGTRVVAETMYGKLKMMVDSMGGGGH
jgi:acyl-CoA thioesterase-1